MDDRPPRPLAAGFKTAALAGLLLLLALALAYGPAKLKGHSIYGGVIQDVTNLYGFYCWDEFSRAELLAGRFPLWNPHNGFGVPHLANMQTAIFYPLNWLKLAFGVWPVMDLLLMLRLWLAGMFTYLLARSALRTSFFASLLAAVAFMLSGHLTRYVYMSHLNVEVLLPLQALLMLRLAQKLNTVRLALAALGFALLVVGGFPEATLYAVCLSMAYYMFNAWKIAPGRALPREGLLTILPGLAALAMGLVISAPQWLPFAEYYGQAWTYHDAASGLRRFDPRLLVALILPWFFGENDISPAAPFLAPYLGLVPVLLGLYAVSTIGRAGRQAGFFAAGAVVLAGVMYGLWPFSLAGRVFPFSLTYNDKYAAPALCLCVALAAGAGLEVLGRSRRSGEAAWPAAAAAVFLAVSVVFGYNNMYKPIWALGLKYSPLMLPAAIVILTAFAIAGYLRARLVLPRAGFEALVLALALAGLLLDLQGHKPAYHDRLADSAGLAMLKKTVAGGGQETRVYADPELNELRADRLLPAGLDDPRSYDPLYPKTYVEYLALANGLAGDTLLRHYHENMLFAAERDRIAHPLWALANVGWFALPEALDERPAARAWAGSARTMSPRQESWLRAETVVAGAVAEPALIEHAPARIEAGVPKLDEGVAGLLWDTGVPDSQVFNSGKRGDGVFFAAFAGSSPARLGYARYLDPKRRSDDLGWRPAWLRTAGPEAALTLLPGPGDDHTRDAGAFGRLRWKTARAEPGFSRKGSPGHFFIYRNENALPRVMRVLGAAPPAAGRDSGRDSSRDSGEALLKLSELGPGIFKSLVVLEESIGGAAGGDTVSGVAESVSSEVLAPGRRTITSVSPQPGFVLIGDQYFPGFRAFSKGVKGEKGVKVEEEEVRIFRGDVAFMAVMMGAGEERVRIEYQPWGFRMGLGMGLAGMLSLIATYIACAFDRDFTRKTSRGI